MQGRTEPAQAADCSEERVRFMRELVENLDEVVCYGPPDLSRFDYASSGFERIFGIPVEEIYKNALAFIDLAHPDDRDRLLAHLNDREDWSRSIDYRIIRRDGETRHVRCRTFPLYYGTSKPVMLAAVVRDVTSIRQTEEELRRANTELEQRVQDRTAELEAAVRELEGFTYSVSHDLRGPLRSIMASAMILKEDFGSSIDSEGKENLDRMGAAAKKMATLIDELLKISRLNRQEMRLEPLDLSAIASEVANETGRADRIRIQPGIKATGDERLLRLVLFNMFDNALKYVSKGDEPAVEFGRDAKGYFVRDTGMGFDQEYAEKIFKPFERLVRDSDYPGSGVGLANVQRIVQRHGGKVWAESKVGEGTTFYFTL
ncbi:MAG TPA: ATP-binding protein [Fimbriimonas sp.]